MNEPPRTSDLHSLACLTSPLACLMSSGIEHDQNWILVLCNTNLHSPMLCVFACGTAVYKSLKKLLFPLHFCYLSPMNIPPHTHTSFCSSVRPSDQETYPESIFFFISNPVTWSQSPSSLMEHWGWLLTTERAYSQVGW